MEGVHDFLPLLIQEEFGFYDEGGTRKDDQPILINKKYYTSLADANDGGCTFDQIADYIEEHYRAL